MYQEHLITVLEDFPGVISGSHNRKLSSYR